MSKQKGPIPYYEDINDYLGSIPVDSRTEDALFYCYRLKENNDSAMYKPPFRRGFYYVGLLTNAGKTRIAYDNTSEDGLDSLIVFQSPGLIYSFYRDIATHGYIIYFKSPCFSYFNPPFEKEFPFSAFSRPIFSGSTMKSSNRWRRTSKRSSSPMSKARTTGSPA
jgi:hypothetical protein